MSAPVPMSRVQAAEVLGLAPTATAAEATATFMYRVRQANFAAPAEWRTALDVLRSTPCDGFDAKAAVAEFASNFWMIPAEQRRQRWLELRAACANGTMERVWLERLEAGVDIPVYASFLPNDDTQELAAAIQTLFVTRPAEQAYRRHEYLKGLQPALSRWRKAAKQLELKFSLHAAIGQDLLHGLAKDIPFPVPAQTELTPHSHLATPEPLPNYGDCTISPSPGPSAYSYQSTYESLPAYSSYNGAPKSKVKESSGVGQWIWVPIVAASLLRVACSQVDKPTPTFKPPPIPQYNVNTEAILKNTEMEMKKLREQLEKDRRNRVGTNPPPFGPPLLPDALKGKP